MAQHPLAAFKAQAATRMRERERKKNRQRAKRSEVLAAKNCGRLTEVTKQQQQQVDEGGDKGGGEAQRQHAKGALSAQRSGAR